MAKQPVVEVSSISPVGLLWVAFIIMKVAEVIHWSWWIVIFWPLALLLVSIGIGLTFLSGFTLYKWCKEADSNAKAAGALRK